MAPFATHKAPSFAAGLFRRSSNDQRSRWIGTDLDRQAHVQACRLSTTRRLVLSSVHGAMRFPGQGRINASDLRYEFSRLFKLLLRAGVGVSAREEQRPGLEAGPRTDDSRRQPAAPRRGDRRSEPSGPGSLANPEAGSSGDTSSPPSAPARVLLAEDNRDLQQIFARQLTFLGLEVLAVTNGRDATDYTPGRTCRGEPLRPGSHGSRDADGRWL